MRLATILEGGRYRVAVVRDDRWLGLGLTEPGLDTMRGISGSGAAGLRQIREWVERQPESAYRPLDAVELGPAMPDPGAIFTIGLNYATPGVPDVIGPERPMVFAKLPTSVTGHGSVISWDPSLTANVDAECELGVVIGIEAFAVPSVDAMRHVFGYTCINDMGSRDPWLDGDQWLLGKSMAGFCPVGPWIVTSDELAPEDMRLRCTVNGVAIQDGNTTQMRFSIPEVISFLSRHTVLRSGDLIATGTPARLDGPFGPDRHLEAGDVVTAWIEGIGELTTTIA